MGELAEYRLTEKQTAFVQALIETGDKSLAATMAGYGGEPAQVASHVLRTPAVTAAIRLETARRLQHLAPVAIKVMEEIMTDATAPKGVRLDAAKAIADRAGYVAPRAKDADSGDMRSASEMSTEELRVVAARLQSEIAQRAKPVSAPNAPVADKQLADFLD